MPLSARRLFCGFLTCAPLIRAAHACDTLPSGQTLFVRLSAPVTTWTAKPGDPVRAVLTRDLTCGSETLLPAGTPITGTVRARHKVGLGFYHETAALDLQFTSAAPPDSSPIPLLARVGEVNNAREAVHNGVIEGIRSSNTFQGTINSHLIHLPTWLPYSDFVLILFKTAFPVFPEPEIFYPAGTDLQLLTSASLSSPGHIPTDIATSTGPAPLTAAQLSHLVQQLPWRVATQKDTPADIVNLVFLGPRDVVAAAFHEAGWNSADPLSSRAVVKNFYALLNNDGYPNQPMRTFYLAGKPEDMNWQKSLNSYGRRDHLRIWSSILPSPTPAPLNALPPTIASAGALSQPASAGEAPSPTVLPTEAGQSSEMPVVPRSFPRHALPSALRSLCPPAGSPCVTHSFFSTQASLRAIATTPRLSHVSFTPDASASPARDTETTDASPPAVSASPAGDTETTDASHPAATPPPTTIWLSSSTHDTSAVLNMRYHGFVHHIAPDLDQERSTVLGDLAFAGCVRSVALIPRPSVPTSSRNATGDPMHTDGSVAVVTLQPCHPADPDDQLRPDPTAFRPGTHLFRFFRREILTVRSDLFRANIIYGAYELGVMAFNALRHKPTSIPGSPSPAPPPTASATASPTPPFNR